MKCQIFVGDTIYHHRLQREINTWIAESMKNDRILIIDRQQTQSSQGDEGGTIITITLWYNEYWEELS